MLNTHTQRHFSTQLAAKSVIHLPHPTTSHIRINLKHHSHPRAPNRSSQTRAAEQAGQRASPNRSDNAGRCDNGRRAGTAARWLGRIESMVMLRFTMRRYAMLRKSTNRCWRARQPRWRRKTSRAYIYPARPWVCLHFFNSCWAVEKVGYLK